MDLVKQRKLAVDQSLGMSGAPIYSRALELLHKNSIKGDFLDFGAGVGDFVTRVHQAGGFSGYSAVDLMQRPAQIAAEIHWSLADLNGPTQFSDNSFDTVTALEVIEHLENPRQMLRELFRLVKPDGLVILSTPNNESYRAILSYWLRGHFVAFTDRSYPAHITPVNRKDIARAALEAGFKTLDFYFSDHGCVPGITKITWQKISLGLLKGLRFSDNVFVILKKP